MGAVFLSHHLFIFTDGVIGGRGERILQVTLEDQGCLSYTLAFTILATIHHISSRCDLYCQIGMDKTENSEITMVSHDVFTVSMRIHYD